MVHVKLNSNSMHIKTLYNSQTSSLPLHILTPYRKPLKEIWKKKAEVLCRLVYDKYFC
uniref:Uncharacterized protein n=1 Tax=Rhizophora mucronata TaxID=61149 RepID=A0A2P2N8J0_RHIMU